MLIMNKPIVAHKLIIDIICQRYTAAMKIKIHIVKFFKFKQNIFLCYMIKTSTICLRRQLRSKMLKSEMLVVSKNQ